MSLTKLFIVACSISPIFSSTAHADYRPTYSGSLEAMKFSSRLESGKFIEINGNTVYSSTSIIEVGDADNELQLVEIICSPGTVTVSLRSFYCFTK